MVFPKGTEFYISQEIWHSLIWLYFLYLPCYRSKSAPKLLSTEIYVITHQLLFSGVKTKSLPPLIAIMIRWPPLLAAQKRKATRRFSGLGPEAIVMCTNGSLIHITERHPVNRSDMIYLTKSVLKFSYLLQGTQPHKRQNTMTKTVSLTWSEAVQIL